ncbi:helix-turn-helix domain-containing protein [Herbiconiux moechotypicola]|uniref:HTH cro/C1-type domain-containing protein n=1 Tax=Herbiconiux moechotypicola TaxID=637393 RepID=A0ABN3DEL8_9MICO|nr:XRE family transcriptional regulator [Herbiconiux moechotypicola]MCS5729302.1 helix-turn-helix domain-containing protein [Herbiconiux moechotypicola]
MMAEHTQVSALVRAARQEAELTLEDLSERSGVSVRGLSDIERGVSRTPRRSTLEAIGQGLGLSDDQTRALVLSVRQALAADASLAAAPRPHRLLDFTGRDTELEVLGAMMVEPAAVIVLTGAGGFGKTSLALEAMARRSPDGFAFLDLGGTGRVPLTPLETVQRVLKQLDDELAEPPGALDEAIARWQVVAESTGASVLLDNVASEDQARPLLAANSRGPIVLTSRRTVAGITASGRLHVDSLPTESSTQLLERIIPSQQRTADAVAELVQLCHGVPLALRIAGNRVASRPQSSVADYVERMRSEERRLALLVAGDRSVEAAFALSYDELDPGGAKVFRALAMIEGPTFDPGIAAAAAECSLSEAENHLEGLVDLGLLEVRQGGRYRLHDLLRVFATSRLRLESTPEQVRDAQDRLSYWLVRSLLEVVAADSTGVEIPEEWDVFAVEGWAPPADRLAQRRWVFGQAEHWWPALTRVAGEGDLHAPVLVSRAMRAHVGRHEWNRWHELNELARASAERLGTPTLVAEADCALVWTSMTERGDPVSAQRYALEALAIATAEDDTYLSARSGFLYAWARAYTGQLETVLDHLDAAIEGYAEAGALADRRQARTVRGMVYRLVGRPEESAAELLAVLSELPAEEQPHEEFGDSFSRTTALEELANTSVVLGDSEAAVGWAERFLGVMEPLGSDVLTARAGITLSRALLSAGRAADARALLEKVEATLSLYPGNGHVAIMMLDVVELRDRLG